MVLALGWQESQAACQAWINTYGLTYAVLSDLSTATSQLFIPNQGGTFHFPHNCVVDQYQILRYSTQGWNQSAIESMLQSLMEPEAAFDPTELNYGVVDFGNTVDLELTIDNAGTGVLQVTNITASDPSLFSVTPNSGQVYAVDDSLVVTVTLHALQAGSINEELTIETNDGIFTVGLTAQVTAAGPFLVVSAYEVDDLGNPNGMLEYGETARLSVTLQNIGIGDALNAEATMVSSDRYVTIVDSFETYGTIGEGLSVERVDAFEFDVHGDVPDGYNLQLTLNVTADESRLELEIPLPIEAHSADFQVTGFIIDDVSGNGNGILDPGETADITLTLTNDGSAGTSGLTAVLTSDSPYLQILSGSSNHAGIASLGAGTFAPDYQVSVSAGCPDLTPAVFYLTIDGSRSFMSHLLKPVTLGTFQEAVENGQGAWTHDFQTSGFDDQWHISTTRSHSPSHSWKCGDTGTGNYQNRLDAVLMTPPLTISDGCQLTFWHWMEAEISGTYPDSAYDGGIVEISMDGGPWTQITPQGGYNKTTRYSAGGGSPYSGPFAGTPCYSGSIAWNQASFDLTGYSGSAQVRFRFGSDNGSTREGWYVDDIQIDIVGVTGAPVNLEASLDGSEVTLTWNSPGVNPLMSLLSYNIYRNSVKIDSLIQDVEYVDDLAQMTYGTYLYQVSAQYDDGESSLTTPVPVNYVGSLDPVQNLVISVVGNHVLLNWSAVVNATSYRVYRADNPGDPMGSGTIIGTPINSNYLDSNVLLGNPKAFYVVTATNE